MKSLKCILYCSFLAILLFLFVGESVFPKENPTGEGEYTLYEGEWKRVFADGSEKKVEIPGNLDAERNEIIRIETVLTQDVAENWYCMRASQQDMKIYVGEELREEYTTKDSRLFGENSASAFVFFKITEQDAGKTLAIELVSDTEYAGFINEVYVGDKYDLIVAFFKECAAVLLVSIFVLVLGSITVGISLVLRHVYKIELEITYFALGLVILSLNMIVESRVRQFFLPNASVAEHVGFLLTMLVPYPYAVYINQIQKKRYNKYYKIALIGLVGNFFISTALQCFNIVNFIDSMVISYALIAAVLLLAVATIVWDIRKGYLKEYGELAVGFAILSVVAVWEFYVTFVPIVPFYGGFGLSIGLILMLFFAAGKTARDVLAAEREKQRAIAAGEAKTTFLANMSHEIRTPINTIIGMNEMILREGADEKIIDYANNAQEAGRLLLGLINDILDFSKIESGKLDLIEEEYHVNKMLEDVVNGVKFKATDKGLAFYSEIEESLPSVLKGDELRIRQICNNMLSNAVKYTKKGQIIFSVAGRQEESGFSLCIKVEDTGIGIKPKDLENLFESFRRLDEKENRYVEGTGLGLKITKQLVNLMGGTIEVTSTYGLGSCFTVVIPQQIMEAVPVAWEEVSNSKKAIEKTSKLYAPKAQVLVVDDNEMNLKVACALLKRTGINLTLANSGMECLELCRTKKFDLILMDHMMPELDGIETLHILVKDEQSKNRDTVVIVLTANAISGVEEMYKKEGFADYLSKPIAGEQLEEMIAKYLKQELKETIMQEGEEVSAVQPKSSEAEHNILLNEVLFELDKKSAMLYCMNDPKIYQEMCDEYCKQGEETLAQLKEYYEKKDWKNYKIKAHGIKSISLVVGAVAFSERAKEMEGLAAAAEETKLLEEGTLFIKEYEEMLKRIANR